MIGKLKMRALRAGKSFMSELFLKKCIEEGLQPFCYIGIRGAWGILKSNKEAKPCQQ